MTEPVDPGRRGFLKRVALASTAANVASHGLDVEAASNQGSPEVAPSPPPLHAPFTYPRQFSGRQRALISFPLGGVAAGGVGLGGRGELRDWQIFNRPDKGLALPWAFPAIWVQVGDDASVARVIEARWMPPYETATGMDPGRVAGLDRLDECTFTGEYPLATVSFRDATLPVVVSLEAFTPFVPLDADDSGLPVAILRYRVSNPGARAAKVSIVFSLENTVGRDPRQPSTGRLPRQSAHNELHHGAALDGLLMTDPESPSEGPMAGSLALGVARAEGMAVTCLRGWPRGKWWAGPLLFWDDFTKDGRLGPEPDQRNAVGSVCAQRTIAPGASADYTFVVAWHFPNRTPAWCGWNATAGDERTVIGNHYCTRFADAMQAAEHAMARLPVIEPRMRDFLSVMRNSTLPAAVKDAAMSNLSTLASPTCFRTSDGRFRGFEGVSDTTGCGHGSCTHVWNYESATQYLFPTLARSMREAALELSDRLDGVMPFRLALPEGRQTDGWTAIDGTMGQIVKSYLDWQLSGDEAWLRRWWPSIRRAMAFSWVAGGWDADRDGVAEGAQHNTYDVEFYGPNPMGGVYYLAGLKACEAMATAVGDRAFAQECRRMAANGSAWIDQHLFNGEYYIQKVQGIPAERIAMPLRSKGGSEDSAHPDFQLGDGCMVDQLVGQYVADFTGLGPLLSPANIEKTLRSIYKYNYKRDLYRHNSVQRTFALNDESALVICDYGAGTRPAVPFPYFGEVMTGFEYSASVLMLSHGLVKEGVECIENIRRRYDGERRNPWDEAEYGHHYARAMAAWSAVVALSGFRYEGATRTVSVSPILDEPEFRCFWSTATGWGSFSCTTQTGQPRLEVSVVAGTLACAAIRLGAPWPSAPKATVVMGGSRSPASGRARTGESRPPCARRSW